MRKLVVGVVCLLSLGSAWGETKVKKQDAKVFYVYKDAGSRENNFCPAGWMGSYKSLKYNGAYKISPQSGTTAIQIVYDVKKDSETMWAGIYWSHPCSNWGDKKGGYNLDGFKKLSFWVKGDGFIDKIGMGGITGQTEEGDSADEYIERIELTPEWKQYTIDLKGVDLSHIIGGFVFAASAENNDKNIILMIDEVRYER